MKVTRSCCHKTIFLCCSIENSFGAFKLYFNVGCSLDYQGSRDVAYIYIVRIAGAARSDKLLCLQQQRLSSQVCLGPEGRADPYWTFCISAGSNARSRGKSLSDPFRVRSGDRVGGPNLRIFKVKFIWAGRLRPMLGIITYFFQFRL